MNVLFRLFFIFSIAGIISPNAVTAQTEANVQGHIRDSDGKPLPSVSIIVEHTNIRAISNDSGYYQLKTLAYKQLNLTFSSLGYQTVRQKIRLQPGETATLDVILPVIMRNIQEVSVTSEVERASNLSRINTKDFGQIPNASGNFESLIKTMPGVSSSNELSSQYSVRGGNFDENLVYVNDVEIIRPFLIRSGQQEGLSFINPDMVSSVKFSAGGFEARYGDKMSSVLDVAYRKPTKFQSSVGASFLGGSATVEGISKNSKFSFIGGARYKTSQYLLNSLETKGEFNPAFIDLQSMFTYQFSKKLEFSFLGNYAQNKYRFIPETRSTNFGTSGSVPQVYNLTIYYEGQEIDKYVSTLGAFTLNYKPVEHLSLKLIASGYGSYEQETFDIEGFYLINELDADNSSGTFGDSLLNIGVGSMLNHARNYLWTNSWSVSHIGVYLKDKHTLRWSLEWKQDQIDGRLNEWSYMDSAGYSVPYSPNLITLSDYAEARNNLTFTRISGYLQDTWQFGAGSTHLYLNGGIRFNYWDYNKQWLVSPRMRLSVKPNWVKDYMFFFATGVYSQPPFYKELRDFHGNLNPHIKAQQSIHFVAGSDHNLKIWDRPFKLTSEIYYKILRDLIPYKVDNVRTRYIAKNNAKGYATGIDFKLNGEFVPGIESWASLSLLKTEENQSDDYYVDNQGNTVYPGYYPRPTDQRFTFSMFFQDYLPSNPTFQVHLNLVYGSALPVSPPYSARFDEIFKMGPYRRVDIGFSKTLKEPNTISKVAFFNHLNQMQLSFEVFNLLNIGNKASYLWVKTVSDEENIPSEFAVPNYLTSRRINVKLSVKF